MREGEGDRGRKKERERERVGEGKRKREGGVKEGGRGRETFRMYTYPLQ